MSYDKVKTLLKNYQQPDLWLLLLLGFSSGLPFLLILSTFSYWLNELSFTETAVSLFTIVSLPYCLKAFWAPYVENVHLPFVGRYLSVKKSWGIVSQFFLIISLFCMGKMSPADTPYLSGCIALLVCLFSATQDIVLDGLRLERFNDGAYGAAASMSGIGFHLGKLASGSGALYLAHWYNWETSYQLMALGVLPGIIALILFTEKTADKTLVALFVKNPFQDSLKTLLNQKGVFTMIAFILTFKISDAVLQGTAATFLYKIGLSKIEFANYTKLYGTIWMIVGASIGGFIIQWLNVYTATIMAALIQVSACLMFAVQAHIGYDPFVLSISIGLESFSSGIVTCTLIAMISHFVQKPFSTSHYTMLYSFGSLSRVIVSVSSGYLAYNFGWSMLYSSLSLLFIPMFFLVFRLQKIQHETQYLNDSEEHKHKGTLNVG